MKIIKEKGHKIEIYDSIDELPILRFHKYNKMLLIDSGVGSDLSDFDNHLVKIMQYCKDKKNDLAERELMNLRQNIYLIQSELSPKHLAFATLVKKIDDKLCDDITDEGLKGTIDRLKFLTKKELTDNLSSVKKKIDEELNLYFPSIFDDVSVKEYYDKLKKRTLLLLQGIINEDNIDKEIEEIDDELITYAKPQQFTGKESVEIKTDKQFENLCLILAQQLNINPKSYNVLAFYNAFEYLKKEIKKNKKR